MYLDKYIERLLVVLNKDYHIKLNVFYKVDNGMVKKSYQIICESLNSDYYYKNFYNSKKELVKYLLWLND